MKYLQIAGSDFGQTGHGIDTLEQGEDALDSAATR